jgi:hypothetical protein
MISEDHPGLLDVEEAAELHEAFEMVDIDGSGQLPVRAMGELVDALVEMQAGRQESLIQQQPEPISCILTGVRMPSDMEMYDMMHIADPSGKGVMTLQYFAAAVADFVKKVKKELGTAPPSPVRPPTEVAAKNDEDDDDYDDDGFDDDDDEGSMEEDFEIAEDDEEEDFLGN